MSKREKGLILYFISPIRRDVRKAVQHYVRALGGVVRIEYALKVFVVPSAVITDAEGNYGFGAFYVNKGVIIIAGQQMPGVTRTEWLTKRLPVIICHELAHYEQFRDQRPIQERGIKVRVRSLLRGAGIAAE